VAERERAANLHPYRHIGQPNEVAMTAVFLASDEAPFINAAIIPMDGGRSVLYHEVVLRAGRKDYPAEIMEKR